MGQTRLNYYKSGHRQKPCLSKGDVDFPEGWSLNAINIVAQKYFSGTPGTAGARRLLRKLVDRVADTITRQGSKKAILTTKQKQKILGKN
jgi:ribonucleoside-diphosphate reductase alpha chain